METIIEWEFYGTAVHRMKVEGGYLYSHDKTLCFVPDVDLQRYQSHLRDAYKKGYEDGHADGEQGITNPDESPYHGCL